MPMQDYGMFGTGNAPIASGNAPIASPTISFDKPSPAPVTTVTYNPPTGPVGNAPINRPFPDLKPPTSRPTGGLSFSFGIGGGGGGGSSAPSSVLNTRQFAPYESTYTPPTPAIPIPYDYATRSSYVYGDGLSNAGAAYNIWGSKPGENPYIMTTPADYTPGLLGLDPITLPNNLSNKGADISAVSNVRQKFTGTPEQIIRDFGYTGRTVPMQNNVPPSMRDSAPNAQVMLDAARKNVEMGRYDNMQKAMDAQQAFNLKYPTSTPAKNKAQIAKSQAMLLKQDQRPRVEKKVTRTSSIPSAGTGASGPPGRNYSKPPVQTQVAIKNTINKIKTRPSTPKDIYANFGRSR